MMTKHLQFHVKVMAGFLGWGKGRQKKLSKWEKPAYCSQKKFRIKSQSFQDMEKKKYIDKTQGVGRGEREKENEAVGAWGPIASPAAVRLLQGLQYHLFHYTIS